jgi:hypothetical protein
VGGDDRASSTTPCREHLRRPHLDEDRLAIIGACNTVPQWFAASLPSARAMARARPL